MFLLSSMLLVVSMMLQATPGPADSVVLRDIRVTLLDAKRLSFEEYQRARLPLPAPWAGGGFRFVFLTENIPGAPLPPALGDVRVVVGSTQYNAVVNPNSRKPFPPLMIIRDADEFLSTARGAALKRDAPFPRQATTRSILEVFIPGGAIDVGTSGFVELELGETYRSDAEGRVRFLQPKEMAETWTAFRFRFPPID